MTGLAVSINAAFSASSMVRALSQDRHKSVNDRMPAEYAFGEKTCDSQAGNAKVVCMAEIQGRESMANADRDARQKPTPEKKRER